MHSRHAACSLNAETPASTSAKPRLPEARPMSARSAKPTVAAPEAPGSASRTPSAKTAIAHNETGSPRNLPQRLLSTVSQLMMPPRLQKLVYPSTDASCRVTCNVSTLPATPTSARTTATRCRVGLGGIADERRSLSGAPWAFKRRGPAWDATPHVGRHDAPLPSA